MKLFATLIIACLFFTNLRGQSDHERYRYSFFILNGISNLYVFQNDNQKEDPTYVNGFRFQFAFKGTKRYRAVVGLTYGKVGESVGWVCGSSWDYCETLGVPPIAVQSIERYHFASLFLNSKINLPYLFYVQGGLSIDSPFRRTMTDRYTSSLGKKSKDKEGDWFGLRTLLNSSMGMNFLVGKQFPINEKWHWFVELEGKMYNVLTYRLEDYESYFFRKEQKPWVLGVSLGVGI